MANQRQKTFFTKTWTNQQKNLSYRNVKTLLRNCQQQTPEVGSDSIYCPSRPCQPHVPSKAHMSLFFVLLTCPSFTFSLASCTLWCSNVPLYCLTHLSVIRLPNSLTFPLRLRCPSLLSFTLVLLLLLYQPHVPSEAHFFPLSTCPFTSLPASYTFWSLHVPL